jgi:hypothetical protein
MNMDRERADFWKLKEILEGAKIPTHQLGRLWEMWGENKEAVRKILGDEDILIPYITPENTLRASLPDTTYRLTTLVYKVHKDTVATLSFTENKVTFIGDKNTYKLSRIITEALPHLRDFDRALIYDELNISKDASIVTKLFDQTVNGRCIRISSRFIDIMAVNHGASYTSCYDFGKAKYNAVTAYAHDPYTVVAFVSNGVADSKHGRCWVHIFPEERAFALGRPFGAMNPIVGNLIRDELMTRLGPLKWKVTPKQYSMTAIDTEPSGTRMIIERAHKTMPSPIYWDGLFMLAIPDPTPTLHLNLYPGFCLKCGSLNSADTGGVCGACAGGICRLCGEHSTTLLNQTCPACVQRIMAAQQRANTAGRPTTYIPPILRAR